MKRACEISGFKKEKRKKRRSAVIEPSAINSQYLESCFKEEFRSGFEKKPFPHWQLRNFVENSGNVVESVESELQELEDWKRKENDLYSLYQTDDFKTICPLKNPSLYSFRQFLYSEVRKWLQEVSGVELIEQVDCNGSCYSHTDLLLPHNDLIDTRRFAFVYYLTSQSWDPEVNGGNLELFNSDQSLNPTSIAKKLVPLRNSLVLFEVSEKSWHRVAEMLSDQEPRLSINGWFHSRRTIHAKTPPVEDIPKFLPIPGTKLNLRQYINDEYLKEKRQDEVQEVFADKSELNLTGFLLERFHKEIYDELEGAPDAFKIAGPLNKRCVMRIDDEEIAKLTNTKKLKNMMGSTNFLEYIEKISGVLVNGSQCSVTVSRVEHGTYWVVGDEDAEESTNGGYCLDVHFFVQKKAWPGNAGGELIYISEGIEEELLRISPNKNAMSMIFREPGVMSFLKFANSKSEDPYFLFSLVYHDVKVVD